MMRAAVDDSLRPIEPLPDAEIEPVELSPPIILIESIVVTGAGMLVKLTNGQAIGPLPIPRVDSLGGPFSLADRAAALEALGDSPSAAALRVEARSEKAERPRLRPPHRLLTSPRRWAMRRFYRGPRMIAIRASSYPTSRAWKSTCTARSSWLAAARNAGSWLCAISKFLRPGLVGTGQDRGSRGAGRQVSPDPGPGQNASSFGCCCRRHRVPNMTREASACTATELRRAPA